MVLIVAFYIIFFFTALKV